MKKSTALYIGTDTRLPVSNPIMWQFEKTECSSKTFFPDTILGICYVFPVIDIITLFYSHTISLWTEK
jgi:hypothetical protein